MHARDLVELAALVAAHSAAFIRNGRLPLDSRVQHYWSASKCRLDRWGRTLRSCREHSSSELSCAAKNPQPHTVCPVLEEILASEVLTRVWTAAASAYDQRRGAGELDPVVRSVLLGHMEARRRAMSLMVYGEGFGVNDLVALNRLRRRTERWTDVLVGAVLLEHGVAEFAFDAERARHFARELHHSKSTPGHPFQWQLMIASLRAAFEKPLFGASPNPDLNRRIASSVLSCLRQELSDSTTLPKSLWLERLSVTASDTQTMIEQLLALDELRPALHS